jgi:OmpA-OmpF porin, OOP family
VKSAYPGAQRTSPVEQQLADDGRAEVCGIYFDFDSATIPSESEPVPQEIAAPLGKSPAWKLHIEGHTGNIGTAAHTLDLSKRRAEPVTQALIDRHAIDGGRLAPAGFGASDPRERNDTAAGRAHRRRIELVKQ